MVIKKTFYLIRMYINFKNYNLSKYLVGYRLNTEQYRKNENQDLKM
jgi:hypothetical protein